MNFARCLRAWWIAGTLAFVLAELRPAFFAERPLHGAPTANRTGWYDGDFVPGAAYWDTARGLLPRRISTLGSWVESDEWQGETTTHWVRATARTIRVCVAGYPQRPGCKLRAEFRRPDGSVTAAACDLPNPREKWEAWDFHVPDGATELRLVAEDRSSSWTGWFAFSEPFVARSFFASAVYEAAQVLTTLALVLGLLWLPGMICIRLATTPETRAAVLLGAGPFALIASGVVIWILGGVLRPAYGAPACLWLLWAALGIAAWRRGFIPAPTLACQRMLAIAALCALAAVAKSTYSGGPEGELFRGSVSRTLAVGNRSDSRTSYVIAQLVARHLPPASTDAEQYFTPWTFFSRGPLAGLAATPVVFATGGRPPASVPDEMWQPFDPRGFAAYRIVMIGLASMSIVALFLVLEFFVGEAWAFVGGALLALCPFGVHEVMFTWPKLVATAWLLVSFLFAHQRRPFAGGVALGIGYLFHPLSLLWAPWIALWAGGRSWQTDRNRSGPAALTPLVAAGAAFAAGVLVLVGPWMLAGHLAPHLAGSDQAGQGGFIRYFMMADWEPATVSTWLLTRWQNFSNTFLPLWLPVVNSSLRDLNSVYAPAGPLVKFAFSWWNTLPLGLGLGVWAGCMLALWRARRQFAAPLLLLFVAPSLLLTVYWGTSPTGLMRECGHPLLVAVIGLTMVALANSPSRLATLATHPAVSWSQLPETFLMLWLTTLANPKQPEVYLRALDPLWFLVNLGALVAIAVLAARTRKYFHRLPAAVSPE
jgi:hypothetical protein